MVRSTLCDSCDKDMTNARLKMENERLMKELDEFIEACDELHDVPAEYEIVRLENENARLRDLLRDYDKMLGIALSYSEYSPLDDAVQNSLRSRLYNLGIEV